MAKNTTTVIIRRPRKSGKHERHGGHWKVAYADFMTAMMAFFLLLWILSVTDKTKLDGIAQFFTPTENIAGQPGGEGILQGSAMSQEQNNLDAPAEEAQSESGAPNPWASLAAESKRPSNAPAPPGEALEKAGEQFLEQVSNQPALSNLAGNLLVRQIEGQLMIDIVDLGDEPMFEAQSAEPTPNMLLVLKTLAPTIRALPHPIRVTGHAERQTILPGTTAQDLAELTTSRALAVRRILLAEGLDPLRFSLVSGAGDHAPLDTMRTGDPRNRRVTIELGSALE